MPELKHGFKIDTSKCVGRMHCMRACPAQVARALLDLGFDAVWEYAVDIELVDRAITDCVKKWPGPFPLISDSCPVVVRLIQVAYPSMVEQLLPNEILYRLRKETTRLKNGSQANALDLGELIHWGNPEGEFPRLSREHYLPLFGLTDIIGVFDDIEKGRRPNIEFLECHACPGGCVGGNLTVENTYVARSKALHLK